MRLRSGPLFLCLAVALYRAVWLSVHLSGFRASEVGFLLLADLPVLGALAILTWAEAAAARPWRYVAVLLSVVLTAAYLGDVAAVLALNARLQMQDVQRFAVEWWLIPSYLNAASLLLVAIVVAAFLVKTAWPLGIARHLPVAGLGLAVFALLVPRGAIPSHLQKYTGSVLLVATELRGRAQPLTRYTAADLGAFRSEYDRLFEVPFAASRRNIVLVIVESLSAADSYRTSGVRDGLPRFDELSREGRLFRNFVSNFEASEGGIVALLSGVPPLHYPTASTDTFREYSLQPSMVDALRRTGYRCEFLTSVPLQFISMDFYAQSRHVGFTHAAGRREIARYRGAPTYAFESPEDHLLYEEVLARLDAGPSPAFIAAITASSHPPYVDPRGRENSEQQVWEYVQDELWWLYSELKTRGFFENGILLITADHRKMLPLSHQERERYGDSAKARIPLLAIGAGVPPDTFDDRLFQQADLLRLLDRALQPGAPLSPWALWIDRYMYVFGVASNASNVQLFDAADQGRRAFRLHLRGAEVSWLDRPPNALEIERSIHRQRAVQQAIRAARLMQEPVTYGRDLTPSAARGFLAGLSADASLARDPDDGANGLQAFTADSLAMEPLLARTGGAAHPFTLTARGFLEVPADGEYWFSMFADDAGCLAIDRQIVLGCQPGVNEGVALLDAGVHRFDLRFVHQGGTPALRLRWLPPGATAFEDFPEERLLLPEAGPAR